MAGKRQVKYGSQSSQITRQITWQARFSSVFIDLDLLDCIYFFYTKIVTLDVCDTYAIHAKNKLHQRYIVHLQRVGAFFSIPENADEVRPDHRGMLGRAKLEDLRSVKSCAVCFTNT